MVRFLGIIASLALTGSVAERLDVISLPTGFQPEGITLGREWTAYVGSFDDGSIWKGDLSTGEGEVVVSGVGSPSAGLDFDRRSGYLFVAGGTAGTARVYDDNFALVADLTLASANTSTMVNDVIVTKTAAYFTDSFQPQIYSVKLDRASGELIGEHTTIVLSPEFVFTEGEYNANGIEASGDGSVLIVANMIGKELYTIDPETGAAAVIDLGDDSVSGDGLILRQDTLWVTQNGIYGGEEQISEVLLSPDLSCGFLVPRALKSDLFDVPTTACRKGNSLYAVNAKFGVSEEDRPMTEYEIIRVDRDEGVYACPTL